ncbi:hypothetical protein SDC9_133661 [bioreactor metagenome]|uniref:Uncharacterized protein n=1 Tax=bioreactor metagenome TaxID=1076179 RepID=A0A645DDD2_9ZZZZ
MPAACEAKGEQSSGETQGAKQEEIGSHIKTALTGMNCAINDMTPATLQLRTCSTSGLRTRTLFGLNYALDTDIDSDFEGNARRG